MKYGLGIFAGIMLMLTLVLGNPAHALIPHEHSDHHDAGESVTWQSLHSVLRHEDKQALPVLSILTVIAVVFFVHRSKTFKETATSVDTLLEYLRRGIVPHRRFG